MKCEICHKRDAVQAVYVKRDGKDCELYVCKTCANDLNPRKKASPKASPAMTIVAPGEEPPPFVKNFLEATLGLVKGMSSNHDQEEHLVCPTCHATWEMIKQARQFRCPNCWKTFAKEIQTEFLRSEYGPTHIAQPPAGIVAISKPNTRLELERALRLAVSQEDYRKAAEIQKELKRMTNGDAQS